MIIVHVSARLSQDGGAPSGDAVETSIKQCIADAVEGSFDEYPRQLRRMARLRAVRIDDNWEARDGYADVRFSFGLPDELFPVGSGGLQLLVNLLAGDIFPSEVSGCKWSFVQVSSLQLPDGMREAAIAAFRAGRAHDINSIRSAFRLAPNQPLLAFSLKPRVGLTFSEIRAMSLEVLEAGFNVVELDARNLALQTAPKEQWLSLGVEAAQVGADHVTAFSPNLSIPAPQLSEVATQWVGEVGRYGPPVMKVDGGVDGLTSIQSVRLAIQASTTPIITSYPLLRNQLSSAIGPTGWVDMLALSGADIVYPGGRPSFPNERRAVWASHAQSWSRSARVYDQMIARDWPMPTLAGGLHPGHLHTCYELLGPKVAYFLGGAVALHPKGPKEGARLCVAVLESAVELAAEADAAGDDFSDDLPSRLLQRVEKTKYPTAALDYFSPHDIFGLTSAAHPLPFYRRND